MHHVMSLLGVAYFLVIFAFDFNIGYMLHVSIVDLAVNPQYRSILLVQSYMRVCALCSR